MEPGTELDALIAVEVMGYEKPTRNRAGWSKDGKWLGVSEPNYSTSIAHAWKVVDKIKEGTRYNDMLHCTRDPWVTFCDHLSDFDDGFNINFWHITPHTICLAALKAVGYNMIEQDKE